jgi:hypothetical protein
MTRKQAIDALKAAGASDDRKTWTRVYVENRVSLTVANQAWRDGQNFARFISQRDAPSGATAKQEE